MEHVIVERSFSEPLEFAQLQALEERFAWCLEQHDVRFLHTYLSKDGRRMVCVYQAPDAEAVRKSQRQAGLPFDQVWTAQVFGATT